MKRLFFLLLLTICVTCLTQNCFAQKHNGKPKLIKDSVIGKKLIQISDSIIDPVIYPDSSITGEEISQNMNSILQLQKERKAREKKAAIVRIGIGIGFLLLLLIGLNRRKKTSV